MHIDCLPVWTSVPNLHNQTDRFYPFNYVFNRIVHAHALNQHGTLPSCAIKTREKGSCWVCMHCVYTSSNVIIVELFECILRRCITRIHGTVSVGRHLPGYPQSWECGLFRYPTSCHEFMAAVTGYQSVAHRLYVMHNDDQSWIFQEEQSLDLYMRLDHFIHEYQQQRIWVYIWYQRMNMDGYRSWYHNSVLCLRRLWCMNDDVSYSLSDL